MPSLSCYFNNDSAVGGDEKREMLGAGVNKRKAALELQKASFIIVCLSLNDNLLRLAI